MTNPLKNIYWQTTKKKPFPYEWSEQDLYEQIRKLILQYNQGKLEITIPSAEERLRIRYEALKDNYIELLAEIHQLKETIENIDLVIAWPNPVDSDHCCRSPYNYQLLA